MQNKKYIIFFSLFTLIPSFLISVFSLFLFNFALDKYLDKKITTAVNNSYEIAKKYVDEKRNKIESDIVLVAYDLNKFSNLFFKNPNQFKQYLNTQKILRNIDHLYLINNKGELILSADDGNYFPIEEKALKMVLLLGKGYLRMGVILSIKRKKNHILSLIWLLQIRHS